MERLPGDVSWWHAIVFGRRETAPDIDFADMGTAFGLDASMAPPDWDEPSEGDAAPRGAERLNRRSVRYR